MKQIRCSVCDGRIAEGRCQECGMYYRQIRGRYYLNETRPEDGPVRKREAADKVTADQRRTADRTPAGQRNSAEKRTAGNFGNTRAKDSYRQVRQQNEGNRKKISAGTIIYIIFLAAAIVFIFFNLIREQSQSQTEYDSGDTVDLTDIMVEEAENRDIYEWVNEQIPEEGDQHEAVLTAGRYVIGQHLPEGIYQAEAAQDADSMQLSLQDAENFIYHTWWVDEYENGEGGYEFGDLRFYDGAVLTIKGSGTVTLRTHNAQMEKQQTAEANPLTEEVQVTDQILTAGEDFEAGVYDAQILEGVGKLILTDEEGFKDNYYLYADDSYGGKIFRNLIISSGVQVCMENYSTEGANIILIPSEEIFADEVYTDEIYGDETEE